MPYNATGCHSSRSKKTDDNCKKDNRKGSVDAGHNILVNTAI
jgi:hypothetical protein